MSHPQTRSIAALAFALLAMAALLALAAASHANAGPHPALEPVAAADQLAIFGASCSSSCDDDDDDSGGGGGGGGRSPYPVGSAYWDQTGRNLVSESSSHAVLADDFNNWTSQSVLRTFTYTHRLVRSVEFSGGFADYFRAAINGEIDETTTRHAEYRVPSMTKAKLYTRDVTRRYEVSGTKYQDYSDGSRTVVARDSGPYRSLRTKTGLVYRSLP